MQLADHTAIVYGVVLDGIGVDATLALATEGARCALVGTDARALAQVAALARASGGFVETAILDPADAAAVEDHLGELLRVTGRVDVSVHVTPSVAVHVVARHMLRQAAGVIVLVGNGTAESSVDAARARWQQELSRHGVRLVALLPTGLLEPGGDLRAAVVRIAASIATATPARPSEERIMKFALVFAYDPTVTSPTEGEVADWMALDEEWRTAGVTVHEAGFHPREQGRVVRVRDGITTVEKEPTAPAENTIAGYWVVEAADIETATNLAAKLPTAKYGYVEVRQVVELEG